MLYTEAGLHSRSSLNYRPVGCPLHGQNEYHCTVPDIVKNTVYLSSHAQLLIHYIFSPAAKLSVQQGLGGPLRSVAGVSRVSRPATSTVRHGSFSVLSLLAT